uniref:Ecdysone receptor n=1 Tax=Daphnia magna TaxID=35525 RepID=A4F2F6_9CRUS|nr:ecdysone receptor B [Daphnia magna]
MTMGDHGEVSSSSSVPMTTSPSASWQSNRAANQQQQLKYPYGHVTRGANKMLASYSLPGQVMRSNAVSTTTANGHRHPLLHQHAHHGSNQQSTGLMQPPSFAANGGAGGGIVAATTAGTTVLTGLHHHNQLHLLNNGGSPSDEHSLPSSDIGEVDLDLWDLDINGPSVSPQSSTGGGHSPAVPPGRRSSDTSSTSGREDLSPPGSVNGGGGYSVDSFTDAKKKKGPVPRQQEELCLVCGDRASGYHYNALTCEGCKGFFRRSITKNAVYQCKYGNGCDIDMYMRRKCQECRLKKCLTVGMRPECVVPEYQCAVKREAKKAQKEKDRPNSSSLGSPDMKEPEIKAIHQQQQQQQQQQMQQQQQQLQQHIHVLDEKPMIVCGPANGGVSNGSPVKPLSPEQEELINRLVYFQEEFDQPSEEDLRKISTSGIHESDADAKFKHITEMTILTVQLTVEFSKRLPGFDTLLREDQITLLKACSSEVMMLRCARRYDANTDSIVFANNLPYTRESYNMAGVGDTADSLFRFGKTMSLMKVDNAEYALLTAIVIFSERPGLVEARKVEKIQEIYLEALQAYVMNHRVRPMTEFAKLLSVLTELRTLGNLNSEMCFSLKLKNKKLPPFLAEIWDVHS